MDYKEFFLENNKSGFKSKEGYLLKNHPELYNLINNYINNNSIEVNSFTEKIWYFINNVKTTKKCECSKNVKFRNLNLGFQEFCGRGCANKSNKSNNKRKETLLKNYGVDNPFKSDEIKDKIRETNINRYGVDNPFKSDEIKGKIRETNIQKFGGQPITSDIVKNKFKKTMLDKYGVEYGSQIKDVSENKKKTNLNKFIEKIDDEFISSNGSNITLKCNKCLDHYTADRIFLNQRFRLNMELCINCNPIGFVNTSKYETEISDFLDSLNVNYIKNDRDTISPKELDFFIPKNNIGIEFNGVYFHSELFKDKNYHLDKTNSFDGRLIHIFEDEWNSKSEIVKSIIKQSLNIYTEKIYARKCIVKEINNKESKTFLDENHIQGNINSKIRYGLFYNDELVSVMTFGSLRKSLGHESKEKHFELLRFSNKINKIVVGGASKLFRHFIKNNEFDKIITYSEKRLFTGDIYNRLGFSKLKDTQPNYYYVINGIRHNRFKFRKDELVRQGFDPNKTEHEIMLERKIYRIYDCGNFKFEYVNK